eukprot:9716043-Alexandrium_andersonii.AAC.1
MQCCTLTRPDLPGGVSTGLAPRVLSCFLAVCTCVRACVLLAPGPPPEHLHGSQSGPGAPAARRHDCTA